MADPLLGRDALDFLLFDWLGVAAGDPDARETFEAVLDTAERLAADSFLTHYKASDTIEPRLEDGQVRILPAAREALARYAELGLFGAAFAPELGGLGLKPPVSTALFAVFASANIATAGYPMLTAGNARLIATHGSPAQVEAFAKPEIEGRWFGTMALSEPQAGSALGDIRTRAVADGEDALGARYRLFGNKMWISGGDQDASENIVHLVLAKVARDDGSLPEGTRGISLFIVPKWLPDGTRNDVAVAGLNHKMGYRGTANCLLNLGERDGALGWRVGEEGRGLAQMFLMMNEARINVGMGAAALAYRGYRHAARYAAERMQGRAPENPAGRPVPIIEHADVRRMLLQAKAYAEAAVALCLYCGAVEVETGGDAEAVLALLTPVAKTWSSEFGLAANDIAIQVHGGYGYTRDFDVEQLWRDNRLNPIHEGTTGIQAADLLGRKLLRSNGEGLAALRARIDATAARTGEAWATQAAALSRFWDQVEATLATLRADPAGALDDATLFLRAFGHGVVAWLWLDQALAAATVADARVRAGKHAAARFFFAQELPQANRWLDIVAARDGIVRDMPAALFA